MVIEEFSFANFLSFKEMQSLNMTAAKMKPGAPDLDGKNIFSISKISLLKSKAIYGANASGKSNVVLALISFLKIIEHSVKDQNVLATSIDPFRLSTETATKPTFFQLIFWLEETRYRYGFETDSSSIKSEWLFATPSIREQPLFIREHDDIIENNDKHFEEGKKYISLAADHLKGQIFRSNSLFLSSLASFGFGTLSKKITGNFATIAVISGLSHSGMHSIAKNALNDPHKKKFILDFLKEGDTGIKAMDIDEDPFKIPMELEIVVKESAVHYNSRPEKNIISERPLYNENLEKIKNTAFLFDRQESEGTRKLFELSPFVYQSLKSGSPLIIDEFDARLHPLLTKKIVQLFNSSENKNAQLVFVTHDTHLLDPELLRRDQIDFVEKDRYGASHLYTLIEIKGVRKNASFEKDYIQGKYGAIPFLGDFSNLIIDG